MIATTKKWIKPVAVGISLILLGFGYASVYFKYVSEASFSFRRSISDKIINSTNTLANKYDNIVAVQVVNVDLSKNTRYILYTKIKHPEVAKLYNTFLGDNITIEVPVFTDSDIQNARMVKLMNHEFVCSPYKDTISYRYVPDVAAFTSTVCAISVPPQYGEFKGIIGVFLKSPPSDLDKDLLRIDTRMLAEQVFKELK